MTAEMSDAASEAALAGQVADPRFCWADLPAVLRRRLSTDGKLPSAEVFCNLFADRSDLEQFVESAGFVRGSVAWLRFSEGLEDLLAQLGDKASHLNRARAGRLSRNFVAPRGLSLATPTGIESSREALNSSAATKRQLLWPCRLMKKRALATNEGGRAAAEAAELQRWRSALASVLKEAGMPICAQAMYVANPDRVLETAAGNVRPSTLRQRIREWRRFSSWCMVLTGKYWDPQVHVLVDYLEELYGQPCARTKLKSVLAAVSLVERAGGIASVDRVSTSRIVLSTVDTRTAELEQGAPDTKRALPLPLILVMSLELSIMDDSLARYWRAFAWVRLLKVWTASRTDDLLGVLPGLMHLGLKGLRGVFDRTKTSGAGRKVRWLPFFVSRAAWLVEPGWLEKGFNIWKSDGFSFDRDYLVPRPSRSFTSCRPVMASFSDQAVLAKQLAAQLRRPVWRDDRWMLSSELLFPDRRLLSLFSEHSERNLIASLASASGIDRERRSYLGRWHVVEASDEYIRSAWHVVTSLQAHVIESVCSDKLGLADFSLDLIDAKMQELGATDQDRQALCKAWSTPQGWQVWRSSKATSLVARSSSLPEAPLEPPTTEDHFAFFVTVVGKRKLRRLHRKGGCGTAPSTVQRVEYFESLQSVQFDAECRHCFPPERAEPEEEASSISSSTDEETGSDSSSSQ